MAGVAAGKIYAARFGAARFGQSKVKRGQRIKHTALKPPQGRRFIRLDSLGEGYSEKDIEHRLANSRFNSYSPNKVASPKKIYHLQRLRYKPLRRFMESFL